LELDAISSAVRLGKNRSVLNKFPGRARFGLGGDCRENAEFILNLCKGFSHLNAMPRNMTPETTLRGPNHPAEPMPPPIKEPPTSPENPDAPVREPDPEEPEQI
jgi:hypothetical protein